MTKQPRGTHRDRVEEWHKPDKFCALVSVKLIPGFAFKPNREETKAIHYTSFPSAREAKAAVKAAKPCNCDRCACPNTKGRVRR